MTPNIGNERSEIGFHPDGDAIKVWPRSPVLNLHDGTVCVAQRTPEQLGHRNEIDLRIRQAAGKFTRDEAEQLIARLEAASDEGGGLSAEARTHVSSAESLLRRMPAEQLAGELQRRGWLLVEP